jgi:hypothetical protein
METLPRQFGDALSRVEDHRQDRAQKAHQEVRSVLETSQQLKDWGIDTVLIGSYARHTSIHPGKDVDVFSKLASLDASASPNEVFDAFVRVLTEEYGSRARPQNRSVKIAFGSEDEDAFSVDAVPAVKMGSRWAIPNRDPSNWGGGGGWVETDPEKLTELTSRMNQQPTLNGQGMYVPTVKLMRQTRNYHLADLKPGGLYCELLTYWAFDAGIENDGSFAQVLAEVLESISHRLDAASDDPLMDPVLNRPFEPRPTLTELQAAATKFHELAQMAQTALAQERCPAAALWRRILGKNSRGWCFTLPEGCDEEGRQVAPITAISSRGSREAGSFGADKYP